jgi:hypothetical protein
LPETQDLARLKEPKELCPEASPTSSGATPAGWREAQTESLHLYMEKEKTCNDFASILRR